MKIKRSGTAHWAGSGKEGEGQLSTPSKVLDHTRYGFQSRFADGPGTNPEELLGAAHAGCFSMKLAFNLQGAGFTARSIDTTATVILEDGVIATVELHSEAQVPGLDDAKFQELAADAKANCPVSKLFKADVILTAVLR
jgi:osmotically inducible protein OsmC